MSDSSCCFCGKEHKPGAAHYDHPCTAWLEVNARDLYEENKRLVESARTADAMLKLFEAMDHAKTLSNTRDIYRGTTIMALYEAGQSENARLRKELRASIDEYERFLDLMVAINTHHGYLFTQPLMNARESLKRMKDGSDGGRNENERTTSRTRHVL